MGNQGFRGTITAKKYFEGWYLKQVSAQRDTVYSFIPGVALAPGDSHAFIQVLNGLTCETHYISYPLESFQADRNRFSVRIGDSHFSESGCTLAIDEGDFSCHGSLEFRQITPFPATLLAPDIMGWFSYMPFMECFHDLVSLHHGVEGSLTINGNRHDFAGGEGYIEKDRGRSFPECWLWLQCNSFEDRETSLMLSIARIPFVGMHFTGFLGFLYYGGETLCFATWSGAKIRSVSKRGSAVAIVIEKRRYRLELSIESRASGELIAPVAGSMHRRIKESVDSVVSFVLWKGNARCAEGRGTQAGLEITEPLFEYMRQCGIAVDCD